jgi:regulator of sigma E protease
LRIVVQRGTREETLTATPRLQEIKDNFGNTHRLGLLGISRSTTQEDVVTERFGPIKALQLGVAETYFVLERTLSYVGGVITGREPTDQLGGPIRIAQLSGQVATVSFAALLHLTAVLSVSIGLLNLFPVPLLDGGHLVFYAIEAIRGKPLSERAQEYGFRVGFALVLMLMLFATWNDIVHLTSL